MHLEHMLNTMSGACFYFGIIIMFGARFSSARMRKLLVGVLLLIGKILKATKVGYAPCLPQTHAFSKQVRLALHRTPLPDRALPGDGGSGCGWWYTAAWPSPSGVYGFCYGAYPLYIHALKSALRRKPSSSSQISSGRSGSDGG